MSRDRDYNDAYVPKLLKLRDGGALSACAEALNATTPSKKFYEDATYFSRGMFFARPALANEETMARSLDVVRAYLDVWLDRLDEAEREAEAMDGACKFGLSLEDVRRCVLTEASAREAQDAHDAWQLRARSSDRDVRKLVRRRVGARLRRDRAIPRRPRVIAVVVPTVVKPAYNSFTSSPRNSPRTRDSIEGYSAPFVASFHHPHRAASKSLARRRSRAILTSRARPGRCDRSSQ